MSVRPCLVPGCPNITDRSRCSAHSIRKDNRHRAFYNSAHDKQRAAWLEVITKQQLLTVNCARCGEPITPETPFDLGHQPDGSLYPEHMSCNRSDGGRRNNERAQWKKAGRDDT